MQIKRLPLPIFVDIDGTLTNRPTRKWGAVDELRLAQLRDAIAAGHEIALWSGGGSEYARVFAARYGLAPAFCLGKPALLVDDNPQIRPRGLESRVQPPAKFFGA